MPCSALKLRRARRPDRGASCVWPARARRPVRSCCLEETDVEVQIAIAGVPVGDERPSGTCSRTRRSLRNEFRQPRDGHGNIVLQAGPGAALASGTLSRRRQRFARGARRARQRHRAPPRPRSLRQCLLEQRVEGLAGKGAQLTQGVPVVRRAERIDGALDVAEHQLERGVRQQLEGSDPLRSDAAQAGQQLHRGGHAGHGRERRGSAAQLRPQLERRGGDDAERALRAISSPRRS